MDFKDYLVHNFMIVDNNQYKREDQAIKRFGMLVKQGLKIYKKTNHQQKD